MSRALRWVPFALGAGLLAAMTLPAGRIPGGDAPHILTIAHRLAAELQADMKAAEAKLGKSDDPLVQAAMDRPNGLVELQADMDAAQAALGKSDDPLVHRSGLVEQAAREVEDCADCEPAPVARGVGGAGRARLAGGPDVEADATLSDVRQSI